MRIAILLLSLVCGSATAFAGRDFSWPHDLSKCHVYKISGHSYELCAISAPAGDQQRKFSLTVRDPSQLDTQDRSPAALQKAKHKLVAEQVLVPKAGEYLHYEMVTPLDLDDDTWIIQVPWVKGTPEDYDEARSVLYVYDGKRNRFTEAWSSPACTPKCKGQTLQLRGKPGVPGKQVFVQQTVGDEHRSIELRWDGKRLAPAK